jgi:hypothetical protein
MRYNPDNDRSIKDGEEMPGPNATAVLVVSVLVVAAIMLAYGAYKLFKYGLITL